MKTFASAAKIYNIACSMAMIFFLQVSIDVHAQTSTGSGSASTALSSITVITDDNYTPYVFIGSNGVLQGILVDQWKEWERVTGIKANIRALPWAEAQRSFNAGEGDVLDTVFINEDRKKIYSFSGPYATIKVPVFLHETISGISRIEDLSGFRVAVKEGDACIDIFHDNGIMDLAIYSSYEKILEAASRDEVKIFCVDEPPALYYLFKLGIDSEYRVAFILNEGQFHRAVRKGDEPLLRRIERGFAEISRDELSSIDRKWLGTEIRPGINLRILGIFAISIAVFVVVIFLLIRTLQRQVSKATQELNEKVKLLEASEAKNKAFLSVLPDIIFTINRDGVFIDTSTVKVDLLAYKPEFFLGKKIVEVGFPPEIVKGFMEKLHEALDEFHNTVFEYDLPGYSGMLSFEGRIVPFSYDRALFVVRDITEKKQKDDLLRISLMEKEVLLKEIHHRVKNNMQVISSLIQLQSYSIRDDRDLEMLKETQARINAMAAIHELLYQSPDLSSVDVAEYLGSLIAELTLSNDATGIQYLAEPTKLCLDEAMPLGLIVNELLLNSLKYAYKPHERGLIEVVLRRDGLDIVLVIRDHGKGLPPDVDPEESESMGFTLVRSLASQLHGQILFGGPPGFSAELRFQSIRN